MKGNILVIVMVIIALMACKTDSDSDPECNCPVKAHLASGETCKCGLANCDCTLKPVCECSTNEHLGIGENCCGTSDCVCTLKVYGNVAGMLIYRSGVVNDSDMAMVVSYITDGYNLLASGEKTNLVGKIDEIHILPGTAGTFAYTTVYGKKVLKMDIESAEWDSSDLLQRISAGTLLLS